MSNRLIQRVGLALYGERWQTPLAADLDMSDRHMRRIVAGAAEAQPGVYVDLLRIATERAAELDELVEVLKRVASP
jgi:transcriptional regulator GlxA family with amidase domain